MKTISTKKLALFLSALFFAGSEMSFANSVSDPTVSKKNSASSSIAGKKKCGMCEKHVSEEKISATDAIAIKPSENSYQPYLQFGGTRFFHLPQSNTAGTVDLFVPIWQQDLTDLIFTDVRITDRSGTPFEGNIHLGYRHLFSESQQSLGFYGAFDRKKTTLNNYFNQITIGGEYWIQNWFIGANYYQPVGGKTKELSPTYAPNYEDYGVYSDVWVTKNLRDEKAMAGTDAEIGYEFIEGLVGYAGGYYFGASNVSTVAGPRARLTYDLSLKNGRILGIFDKVGLETGVQHDKPRGTVCYLSANVRVGWLPDKKSALEGVSRHMVDPVRRDIDVVAGEATHKQDSKKYKIASIDVDKEGYNDRIADAINNDVDVIDLSDTVTLDMAGKILVERKMPAIVVNGKIVHAGFKGIGEKLENDQIMIEALSKSHVHFGSWSIDEDARVHLSSLEQPTKQQKSRMQPDDTKPKSDYYKSIYTWLNDPFYSGVSNDDIVAIGNAFEQLNQDYASGKTVNFTTAMFEIPTKHPTSPPLLKVRRAFVDIMKRIRAIRDKEEDAVQVGSINYIGGQYIITKVNELGLFNGKCDVNLVTKLVHNSYCEIP